MQHVRITTPHGRVAFFYGGLPQMWGSAVQPALNLIGIVRAGCPTLVAWKLLWRTRHDRMTRRPDAPRSE
ncbi:hypothetical protein [Streptomyces sp. NPDC097981]|uniref:hypothetical protein n=1 Tax=Streptomyces sp. NPDC097981 TaxID=3155428 RepID=UPI003317ED43